MLQGKISRGLESQLLASLMMLKDCIDRCPDNDWHESHSDYPFSRVVFHTLFDCDLNLNDNEEVLKNQIFHVENRGYFGDYEEISGEIVEKEYDRRFILKYFDHCEKLANSKLSSSIDSELLVPNSDFYKTTTKLERYVNCIRHTQHHAAQLGLRLQYATGKEMDWVGRIYE